MPNTLPDFSQYEAVYVLGTGISLYSHNPQEYEDLPSVGCNAVVEYLKPTVWCSSHADLYYNTPKMREWLNSGNYDHAFFVSKYIAQNRTHSEDIKAQAESCLLPEVYENINWVDRLEIKKAKFTRKPYKYEIPIDFEPSYSSGLLAADIALRLGAKKIIMVGFGYIPEFGNVSNGDAERLQKLHVSYFKKYPIPVDYRGSNDQLKEIHFRLNNKMSIEDLICE
jgi:hypothetical protein